ncbi:protein AAR2 homolog [Bacillus rossius redtenbacheri]|uniref:protein AAR2 homolog n=1 Tax=Bacillus rossius redtenbacheri TaxID=93214 RepID=UPI002FDE0E5F
MSSGPEMDQDLARRLFAEGGFFVCLGVPAGTELGIDMKVWTTREDFRGVKMIPPGVHYVSWSATNKHGDVAPRVGFVHTFKKSELVVRRWDPDAEDFSQNEVPDEEKKRLRSDLLNLDKFLMPYPFDTWKRWKQLSDKITEAVAERLVPASGRIRSALDLVPAGGSSGDSRRRSSSGRSRAEDREEALLPDMRPAPGTGLRFAEFPELRYPEGSTPAEVTRHSLDSSYVLEALLAQCRSDADFLGEMQFAFVAFLVGNSLDAFEHWRQLAGLLCSCEEAIARHRELYHDALTVLGHQLDEVPEDFLVDIVANSNFIYVSVCDLLRTVRSSDAVDSRLRNKAARFSEGLTARFGWDFSHVEDEDSDEAPVVVDDSGLCPGDEHSSSGLP